MKVNRYIAARVALLLAVTGSLAYLPAGSLAADRTVLCEYFTRNGCSYCAYAGPAMDSMIDNHPGTFVAVEYHWPLSLDGYGTVWGDSRGYSFYRVGGTPDAWFDGLVENSGSYQHIPSDYNRYNNTYLSRRAVSTDVTIDLGGMPQSGSTYTIQAQVCLEPSGTAKTMRIYIVQVLDNWPASPSYSRNTFKQAAATEVVSLNPGDCATITRTMTFDSTSMANAQDIKIIAWAQANLNSAPAAVYQAAEMGWPFPSLDCDGNGILDDVDLADCDGSPWCSDCNSNGILDVCDIDMCAGDPACGDCNGNGIPDSCDIAGGSSADCDGNGVPDECDLAACDGSPWCSDCNSNGVIDACDIVGGLAEDCDENGIPDACDAADCDGSPWCSDCNGNGIMDTCDMDSGLSVDCNGNGVPDECDLAACDGSPWCSDCNGNGMLDACELDPDYAAASDLYSPLGGVTHMFTVYAPPDAQSDVTLEFLASGDLNSVTTEYVDVELNGVQVGSVYQMDGPFADCAPDQTSTLVIPAATFNDAKAGGNAAFAIIPAPGIDAARCGDPALTYIQVSLAYTREPTATDCNENAIPDSCDIDSGYSLDANGDGIPDECQSPPPCLGDGNCDGVINWRDIDFFVAAQNDNVSAWAALFAPGTPTCSFSNNDVDSDGVVNWHDIDPFVALQNTTCP